MPPHSHQEDAMSAIQSVSAATTPPAAALSRSLASKANVTAKETASQEASESPAVTRIEAASGDTQAIRRLAASVSPTSNQKADATPSKGGINLTA